MAYGLDWETQVWAGDPKATDALIAGLQRHSQSLLRARLLNEAPSSAEDAESSQTRQPMVLEWKDLDQQTSILAMLYNLILQFLGGSRAASIAPPMPAGDPVDEFWARLHANRTT